MGDYNPNLTFETFPKIGRPQAASFCLLVNAAGGWSQTTALLRIKASKDGWFTQEDEEGCQGEGRQAQEASLGLHEVRQRCVLLHVSFLQRKMPTGRDGDGRSIFLVP